METVDTALKSFDLVLFYYNILGTIGIPYSYVPRDFHSRFDPPLFVSFFFGFSEGF